MFGPRSIAEPWVAAPAEDARRATGRHRALGYAPRPMSALLDVGSGALSRWRPGLAALFAATALSSAAAALPVRAQVRTERPHDDGVWGRFGSDLVLAIGANAGAGLGDPSLLARGSNAATFALDVELRLRVIDTAGVLLAPEWRPDGASRLVAAVDLRPVFLARFLFGATSGDRYWDLLFDSLGGKLGATIFAPEGRVAVAWAIGFGCDVPLWVPPEITGAIALRLGGRWTGGGTADVWGPNRSVDDWTLHAGLLVRFHANVGLGRWEPERYRLRGGTPRLRERARR